MNYTANIQNILEKNEMHCIFLSKIHKICSALLFLFLYWKEVQEGLTSLSDNNHIQLVEVALVVLRILVSHLKVIGFPPRSRHIDITLCA